MAFAQLNPLHVCGKRLEVLVQDSDCSVLEIDVKFTVTSDSRVHVQIFVSICDEIGLIQVVPFAVDRIVRRKHFERRRCAFPPLWHIWSHKPVRCILAYIGHYIAAVFGSDYIAVRCIGEQYSGKVLAVKFFPDILRECHDDSGPCGPVIQTDIHGDDCFPDSSG